MLVSVLVPVVVLGPNLNCDQSLFGAGVIGSIGFQLKPGGFVVGAKVLLLGGGATVFGGGVVFSYGDVFWLGGTMYGGT